MNNPLKYIDPSGWGSEGPGSNGGGLLPDDLPSGISNPVPYGGGDSNILPNWNTLWYSNCWSGNYLSGSMSVSWSNGSGGTTAGSGLGDNAFISATNSSPVSSGNMGFSGGPRGGGGYNYSSAGNVLQKSITLKAPQQKLDVNIVAHIKQTLTQPLRPQILIQA